MRGSLGRSLSFKLRHRNSGVKNQHEEEFNIFASDIVSSEFIFESIEYVRRNDKVVVLEIEDLLVGGRQSLVLPRVNALIAECQRDWKSIRFIDSVDIFSFREWQRKKDAIVKEYEMTALSDFPDKCLNKNISWNVRVQCPGRTAASDVQDLLTVIREDTSISDLCFSGALFGYTEASIPQVLAKLMDQDNCLQENIVIHLKYIWDGDDTDVCVTHQLTCCIETLSKVLSMSNSSGDSQSIDARSSASHEKRKHKLRRKHHGHRRTKSSPLLDTSGLCMADEDKKDGVQQRSPRLHSSVSKYASSKVGKNRRETPDYNWELGAYRHSVTIASKAA